MPFIPNSLLIISLLIVYVVLFLLHLQCGVVNHKTTTNERNKETKINIMCKIEKKISTFRAKLCEVDPLDINKLDS